MDLVLFGIFQTIQGYEDDEYEEFEGNLYLTYEMASDVVNTQAKQYAKKQWQYYSKMCDATDKKPLKERAKRDYWSKIEIRKLSIHD